MHRRPYKKMLQRAATLLLFVTLLHASSAAVAQPPTPVQPAAQPPQLQPTPPTAAAVAATAAAGNATSERLPDGHGHTVDDALAAAHVPPDDVPQTPPPPPPPPVASANLLLEEGQLPTGHIVNLTRHHDGDVFHTHGVATCNVDTCVGLSSGTATIAQFNAERADMLHHVSLAGGGNNGKLELLTRRTKAPASRAAVASASAASASPSSATAAARSSAVGESCQCRCLPYQNTYREDLGICVDDVHECTLSPFVSGSSSEKIPFVFLPLRTQIIYPSREISFPDIRTPVCAVTGAQYLTTNGWSELRNPLDNDYPFRMFRDEGRTFLQWLGEADLRQKMQGRLIVVHLVCRDMSAMLNATAKEPGKPQKNVFSPCVAFRVNGTPVKYANNVSEVLFQSESTSTLASTSDGMSTKEYVVIGVCSLLLGLIYVSSVFLYLHMKKRKRSDPRHMRNSLDDLANEINYPKNDQVTFGAPFNRNGSIYSATSMGTSNEPRSRASIGSMKEEMGVVKNNPLLQHFPQLGDHHSGFTSDISNSNSECEMDGAGSFHEKLKQMQTSALVHPQMNGMGALGALGNGVGNHSPKSSMHGNGNGGGCVSGAAPGFGHDDESLEPSTSPTQENECLPVENVSIVEDMMTEEKLENLRAMVNGNVRKKLYFNPAYFEPHLLAQPPPAAVEFLQKIREVIAIAKYKMATKRYQPSLIMIPEEGTPRSDTASIYNSAPPPATEACQACASNRCSGHVKNCGDKRNSIEKWLQSVAIKEDCKSTTHTSTGRASSNVIEEEVADSSPEPQRKANNDNNNNKNQLVAPANSNNIDNNKNKQRCSPRREITPPKTRPPPPPTARALSQPHAAEGHGQGASYQPLYAKGGNIRGMSASVSSLSRHYESFSALSAAANIYGFAETGSEIYNNPKFCLHDSPNASQRSHSSHKSRKRLDVLDQYTAGSTPTSLTSAERQHYEMLRAMKHTPDMQLLGGSGGTAGGDGSSNHDGQGTLTSNGSCGHLDIPTPDYDSTMEKKYKDIYNSAHSSAPSVPTPDYSTLSRKSLKQGQPPDSPIYRRKSPQYLIVDYETDSLERLERLEATTQRKSSQSSSSPSSDVSSQLSPSLSTALPLEEELEINHTVYNNKPEGFRDKSELKKRQTIGGASTTAMSTATANKSSHRSSGKKKDISARIKYDTPFRGSMTIEVEHEPPSDADADGNPSSDGEPFDSTGSTLGRSVRQQSFCDISAWSRQMQRAAAAGYKGPESLPDMSRRGNAIRGAAVPNIACVGQLVRASNSFRREQNDRGTATAYESRVEMRLQAVGDDSTAATEMRPSISSLREIYQSQLVRQNSGQSCKCGGQARQQLQQHYDTLQVEGDQGRLLTLEAKHSRRQRINEPPTPPAVVEITKVANNKTTIKISTPKVNRATLPAKGPPEAAHIEPQVHAHHRPTNAYANSNFGSARTVNGLWKEAPKRSPPPPPPPPQQPNSANTTLSSQRNYTRHHYQNHAYQQSATEEETASNHSASTEITGLSDTLATNSEHNHTLTKPVYGKATATMTMTKCDIGGDSTLGSRRGNKLLTGKQQEAAQIAKKLKENGNGIGVGMGKGSDYGAMFNTQINGLRSDYSLTKYLNRRKSQRQQRDDSDTKTDKEPNNNVNHNNNNNSLRKGGEYEMTRSSGQLSDRTKELYRNAGVPVGIAYPQRSSAAVLSATGSSGGISVTANASTAVAVNNVQTVYRCEIEPLQLTHGMQIAMGLKDRAKKAKDLKNAWRKFVSMAAAKFSPTQSPAPPFEKKPPSSTMTCTSPSPSFFEVLDRDEGISSLIDEQAQAQLQLQRSSPPVPPPPPPAASSSLLPAGQNYYEQRFGVRPLQEMDSGYMSADSAEVYKRSYYDRYNFKQLLAHRGGDQRHIITVDTIEDQSDRQSNGDDGGSPLDSNRFDDLEHNMGERGGSSSPRRNDDEDGDVNADDCDGVSDAESDKTLTQANAMRHSSVYSSEDEEPDGRSSSVCGSSETEGETNAEEMWESGAESIETHSVLYKNVRKA